MKETAAKVLKTDTDYLEYDGEYVFLRNDPSVRVAVPAVCRGYITSDGITIGEVVQASADARLPRYSNPDENGQGSCGVDIHLRRWCLRDPHREEDRQDLRRPLRLILRCRPGDQPPAGPRHRPRRRNHVDRRYPV